MTIADAPASTPTREVWPGKAYPLGAAYDGAGTNFTLFSEVAERVELCLFDADGIETQITLPEVDYEHTGRRPVASINFVTAHDGFTLRDLVSYNEKNNDANGEDNNDGESHNRSWNCGAEGPTDDVAINDLRSRQQHNLITTLLLSQGVPMICLGGELGRTQNGNNNGYCQDNALTWVDWADTDTGLLEFTRIVSALRTDHPVFRRHRFFKGKPVGRRGQDGPPDIAWCAPDGTEMSDEDWGAGFSKSVAVFLNGHGIPGRDARGQRVLDDSFLLCFNAHYEPIEFTLPPAIFGANWRVVVHTGAEDTAEELAATAALTVDAHAAVAVQALPTD